MIDKCILYKSYEFFLSKKHRQNQWVCSKTERTDKLLDNFIESIPNKDSIGIEWLFKYTSFQFSRYRSEHKVPIQKIFGKRAYAKWVNRKSYWDIYATRNIYKVYEITYLDFVTYCTDAKTTLIKNQETDLFRSQNHNTILGFANCIDYTTLFNAKSKWCLTCRFQKHCKQLK